MRARGRSRPSRASLFALSAAPVVRPALNRVGRILLALAITGLLPQISSPPPAQAVIANPIPADASGDPNDFFRADDALFAYFTVDITGGDICVVNADTEPTPGRDCNSGVAWGDANHFVGLGTQYQGLEGPYLAVGTWRLLAAPTPTVANPNPIPSLSIPFTVVPCADTCDPTIGQAAIDAWKAAAGEATEGAHLACQAMAAQSTWNAATGVKDNISTMRAVLFEAVDFAKKGVKASIPVSTAVVMNFAGGLIAVPLPESPSQEMAKNLLKQLLCSVSLMHETIQQDPPDPAFTTVEEPQFTTFDDPGADGAFVLATALDRQRAFGEAMLHAFERYLGALDADEPEFVALQAQAVGEYGLETVREMRASADHLRDYAAVLAADEDLADPVVDQGTLDAITAVNQRVQTDGLLSEEIAELTAEGFTSDEIAQLEAAFDLDLSDLPVGVNIETFVTDAADAFDEASDAFDALAREALSVASIANSGPPVASFTAAPISGDAPLQVLFTDTSTDPDDPITVSWDFGDGTTSSTSPVLHTYYDPGTYTVTLTVSAGGETDTAQTTITVRGPNRPPVAQQDFATTSIDASVDIDVLGNDSDPDVDPLAIVSNTDPPNGSASCPGDGPCMYTPDTGFSGNDSFSYTIADPDGAQATASVTVTVLEAPNVPPVAEDDLVETTINSMVSFSVLANDSDPDGSAVSLWYNDPPEHGQLSCAPSGICTYTPPPDFVGTDTATYHILDGRFGTDTATIQITVVDAPPPVNRAPVASDDVASLRGGQIGFLNLLPNDFDPDGDPLELVDWTEPAHGTLTCFASGFCTYSPASGYIGPDEFSYEVSDGALSDSATVRLTISNDPPTAGTDLAVTGRDVPVDIPVLANDYDFNADALTIIDWTQGDHGSVSCLEAGPCTYTPEVGYLGTDGFRYTITDIHGATATGEVALSVRDIIQPLPDWAWRADRELEFDSVITSPLPFACTWEFGDGTPSSDSCDFAHAYPAVGTYTAELTVAVENGVTAVEMIEIEVLPQEDGGSSDPAVGGAGEVVEGTDVRYTSEAEFDRGAYVNLQNDAPGQLTLNTTPVPFPFVNVAASARGTIVRIDVETGDVLGEYRTAPDGMGRNPSRTTVDQLGNVWVGNRDEAGESGGSQKGSVARIGLVLGGVRSNAAGDPDPAGAFLAPPFLYNTCVDRDGDGLLHTSSDLGDILSWSNAGDVDRHGGVTTAADECITAYTRVTGAFTRTVAVDGDGNVWVGGLDQDHELLDGDTAQPIPGTQINYQCGGYGGLIDRQGVLWSASTTLRYDPTTDTGQCIGYAYGLGLDPVTGRVWKTEFGRFAIELDTDGTVLNSYDHGGTASQGLAVDADGNVWVSHSLSGQSVGRLRTTGELVGVIPMLGGSGPTGVSVDSNGRVWAANISGTAERIDPDIGPIGNQGPTGYVDMVVQLGSDAGSYNYSDMTGFVSIGGTAPQGFWRVVQDGGAAGAVWTSITWNDEAGGSVPAGTELVVEARAADAIIDLASSAFVPIEAGIDPSLTGRYIEVRVTQRTQTPGITPILTDVRIQADGPDEGNRAPVIDAQDDASIPEQVPYTRPLGAVDPDGDGVTWSLDSGPAGLTVSAAGALAWTPTEEQGPGDYDVTVRATDDGTPAMFAIVNFTLHVNEVNRAPSLAAIADQQTRPGEAVSVVASATDPDVPANQLTYALVDGPTGASIDGETGAFSWTPTVAEQGSHTVTIRVVDDGSPELSAQRTFSIDVERDGTRLSYTGATATQYTDAMALSARLTDEAGAPIAGATVTFGVDGLLRSATTGSDGVAAATVPAPGPAGTLPVSATFDGDSQRAPSMASSSVNVGREDATVAYTGDTIAPAGSTVTLRAIVTDSAAIGYAGPAPESGASASVGDVTKMSVVFDVYAAGSCLSGTPTRVLAAVTDGSPAGDGVGLAQATFTGSSEAAYCVVPRIGDGTATGVNAWYQAPPAAAAGLVFYTPGDQKVTGGGHVVDGDGDRANFGFVGNYQKKGQPKGQFVYVLRSTWQGQPALIIVKSNALTGLFFSGTQYPIAASLEGKASVKVISATTGATLLDSGGMRFVATVVDAGTHSGRDDSLGFVVRDRSDAVFLSQATAYLSGGNVVVHKTKGAPAVR